MAKRVTAKNNESYITLNNKEAVELIVLLTGQLERVNAPGNHTGACPSINIVAKGQVEERIVFALQEEL